MADARARGAERWILGGDYALFGPEPEATVALLRGLAPAIWIRGNGERWTAAPDEAPDNPIVPDAIAACREALGADEVAALGALPFDAVDGDARYVHASPVSDVRSFMPRPGDDEAELLAGVTAPRLVFGHTHLPFRRIRPARSSWSTPARSGCRSTATSGRRTRSCTTPAASSTCRVPYDQGAAAARMRSRWPGAGWAETVARRIEQAADGRLSRADAGRARGGRARRVAGAARRGRPRADRGGARRGRDRARRGPRRLRRDDRLRAALVGPDRRGRRRRAAGQPAALARGRLGRAAGRRDRARDGAAARVVAAARALRRARRRSSSCCSRCSSATSSR